MIKFGLTKKAMNLLKMAHKDMKEQYNSGVPIEEIARLYSLEIEYVNIIVLSKNDKYLPEYNEWEFNYLTTLWKNNIDIETIKKLCPVNEGFYSNEMLEWEILNMSRYKNFKEYWEAVNDC